MSKTISYCGVLAALAVVLSYLEALLPPIVPVPGIKLGMANFVIVSALYILSQKEAYFISFVRILIVGLLFGSASSIIYSIAGGFLSLFVMQFFKKTNIFSIIGISVLGAVFHNFGQIFVAAVVVQNIKLFYYMPILIISAIITGIIIGFICHNVILYIKPV